MKQRKFIFTFILFFISGFSALIYQISWQRMLFTRLGGNIESVTIIVSIFMAGLGFGALAGGKLSDFYQSKGILLFGMIELLTGVYGFFSIKLIKVLPHENIILSSSFLLLIPTLLMGATLPLLTSGLSLRLKNVDKTVSTLLFTNTIGSAFASLGTVFILFKLFGLSGSVYTAAFLNILIGVLIIVKETIWVK